MQSNEEEINNSNVQEQYDQYQMNEINNNNAFEEHSAEFLNNDHVMLDKNQKNDPDHKKIEPEKIDQQEIFEESSIIDVPDDILQQI